MHPQPAPRSEPAAHVTVTLASARRHLREISAGVSIVCMCIMTGVAVNAGIDLHGMRRAQTDQLAEIVKFRDEYGTSYKTFLNLLSGLGVAMGSTNQVLADALVRMRAQVKEQVDHSERTASATVTIAKEATKQAAATSELVQQVADTPEAKPPNVTVQQPSPAAPAVVVQPAPVQIHTAAPPTAKPQRRRRWFHLWLW